MKLKEKMLNEHLYGCFIKMIDNPAINILAKDAGLDFLFYDNEHGMYTYDVLHNMILMGNNMGMPSFVRVPQLARAEVSKAVDCGASGVMVPMMESAAQARQLVEWSKYPPIGIRSYSGGANTNYRPSGNHRNNMDELNDTVITIAQVETGLGVQNVEEIAAVEGVDALIVGPADLAISLVFPGDYMNAKELAAIDKVVAACKKYHKGFGIIGKLNLIEKYKNDINFMVTKIDVDIVREGFVKATKDYDGLYE